MEGSISSAAFRMCNSRHADLANLAITRLDIFQMCQCEDSVGTQTATFVERAAAGVLAHRERQKGRQISAAKSREHAVVVQARARRAATRAARHGQDADRALGTRQVT